MPYWGCEILGQSTAITGAMSQKSVRPTVHRLSFTTTAQYRAGHSQCSSFARIDYSGDSRRSSLDCNQHQERDLGNEYRNRKPRL